MDGVFSNSLWISLFLQDIIFYIEILLFSCMKGVNTFVTNDSYQGSKLTLANSQNRSGLGYIISSNKRLQVSISSVEIWEGKVMFVKELCGKKLCVHWILWLLWEKESGFLSSTVHCYMWKLWSQLHICTLLSKHRHCFQVLWTIMLAFCLTMY